MSSQLPSNQRAAHTPGPWGVFGAQDASSDEWRSLCVSQESMPFMRVCFMPSDGTEEIMANARLISAAPELLQALIHLTHNARKSGAEMGLALDVADDAIAKATGASV